MDTKCWLTNTLQNAYEKPEETVRLFKIDPKEGSCEDISISLEY